MIGGCQTFKTGWGPQFGHFVFYVLIVFIGVSCLFLVAEECSRITTLRSVGPSIWLDILSSSSLALGFVFVECHSAASEHFQWF